MGDAKYGGRIGLGIKGQGLREEMRGQALHAQTLGFVHPRTKEYMEFNAPLPEDMEKAIGLLKK